ncbi:MAG TPA: amidohydrolase [Segeticoccus sp.]|uniref:amidohydrolase n=1 Tax=Segeticoccus sp. TaxID=2706531 RepID=UPI002D7E2A42|nr:amidohydrolase [Segeticoccus sp.]HET8601747.1 amidohydrolase [Segeticoccus sp.]
MEPSPVLAELVAAVDARKDDLRDWRRDLHAHPETAWREHRTTAFVADRLTEAGVRVRPLSGTGLVADIGAEDPAYRVALRADLDALPLPERTGLPWASRTADVCHACGHDVHTTAVLGAGLALQGLADRLTEGGIAVRLVFQPAEEVMPGGAHTVLQQGVLDEVDRCLAVHCDPTIDVGQVGLVEGPITAAADAVTVTLTGQGGHTSRPHLTQDLTYALGKVVTDVPAVLSRRLDPRSGVAMVWGLVQAGVASNVIPSTGTAQGTLRVLDAEAWEAAGDVLVEVIEQVVAPYGVTAHVEHVRGVPPVVNDGDAVEAFRLAAASALGADAVVPTKQSLGGEDFAWYLTAAPGALARLGTRSPGGPTYELHQGDLVVDEDAVGVGARLLAAAVLASATGR